MTTIVEFKREQRGVLVSMLGALGVSVIVLSAAATMDHGDAASPLMDRLHYALGTELLVIGWLAATIANVARLRFFSEQDISGSSGVGASDKVREAGAILQNTLEQVVLATIAHVIAAATLSRSHALLVALASLFALGRLLFWVGYSHGPKGRAFGFALSFYPSVLSLLVSAAAIMFGGSI